VADSARELLGVPAGYALFEKCKESGSVRSHAQVSVGIISFCEFLALLAI